MITAAANQPSSALNTLIERVRPSLLTKVTLIEDALSSLLEAPLSPEQAELAQRAAHQLAGSGGTFGMPQATALARGLETFFRNGAPSDPVNLLPAFAQLEELRAVLEAGPRRQALIEPAGDKAVADKNFLIAVQDHQFATQLVAAVHALGRSAFPVIDLASALAAVAEGPWAGALVDPGLPDGSARHDVDTDEGGGLALLRELQRSQPGLKALVLSRDEAFLDRVEASRAGAHSFVDAGQEPGRIVRAMVDTIESTGRTKRPKLVAVDDDPDILAALDSIFTDAEMELTTVSDPLRLWDVLTEVAPDLVLLDVDMPGVTGLELARIIRNDSRWSLVPILVLTGSIGSERVIDVFAAGADDYVSKPVLAVELLSRVRMRLERARAQQRTAEIDPLTGLVNRVVLHAEFDRLRAMAVAQSQPLSVALIDVDAFKKFNADFGYGLGDVVLQRLARQLATAFTGADVVSRWAGQEIAVVMYGMSRSDGVARVATALEEFHEESFATPDGPVTVGFSAGVAEFGLDGKDLHRLGQAAAAAVQQAKATGGERVLAAGWTDVANLQVVDVVLVEDDEALAGVLVTALHTRGLRVVHINDGKEALAQLTGPDRLRCRVVVLDVDIPGINGFDLLGELAAHGTLKHVRVLMLTARSGENEVLATLRQGAFDHISKPFSLPILIQRIRRALEA